MIYFLLNTFMLNKFHLQIVKDMEIWNIVLNATDCSLAGRHLISIFLIFKWDKLLDDFTKYRILKTYCDIYYKDSYFYLNYPRN